MNKEDLIKHRKYIGNLIKELRELYGEDQKSFARKAGLDPANLCRIEQGKYSVGIDVLFKILAVHSYRIEFLFDYESACRNVTH